VSSLGYGTGNYEVQELYNILSLAFSTALGTLRKRAWLALNTKIKGRTSDAALLAKLRALFEDTFRYDANGLPHV